MTSLIIASNSDGVYGRCDANCYDAKNSKCTCICGGMNHGGGKQQAMVNTREYSKQVLKEAGVDIPKEVDQLNFFTEPDE